MTTLKGRRIVVTGASGVLGQAVSRHLLREGAIVYATYRKPDSAARVSEVAMEEDATDRLHLELCDVSEAASVAALVARVTAAGPLHGWAALAGSYAASPLATSDEMLWLGTWRDNATTCFLSLRAALSVMLPQGFGSIVTVSGRPALGASAKQGLYAAAKAAVLRLTEAAAAEGKASGVRANAVVPSVIDHPVNRQAMPNANPDAWVSPDELARVIGFLLSDESSGITGAAVPVYGRV